MTTNEPLYVAPTCGIAIGAGASAAGTVPRVGSVLTATGGGWTTWAPVPTVAEVAELRARLDRLERMVESLWDAPGMPGQQQALCDSEALVRASKAPPS